MGSHCSKVNGIGAGRVFMQYCWMAAICWRHTRRSRCRSISFPGGGIDPGEHPIAALHREVFEETGWRIALDRRLGAFRRFTYMPEYDLWAEKLCTVYLARPVRRLGPPSEAGHRAVWLSVPAALEVLGNPGDRAMLARAAGNHPLGVAPK